MANPIPAERPQCAGYRWVEVLVTTGFLEELLGTRGHIRSIQQSSFQQASGIVEILIEQDTAGPSGYPRMQPITAPLEDVLKDASGHDLIDRLSNLLTYIHERR